PGSESHFYLLPLRLDRENRPAVRGSHEICKSIVKPMLVQGNSTVKTDWRGFTRGHQSAVGYHMTRDRDMGCRFLDRDTRQLEIGMETDGDRHGVTTAVQDR